MASMVDLEWKEPGVPSRGRYGRLLAFVFAQASAGPPGHLPRDRIYDNPRMGLSRKDITGRRIHINVEMVRLGHAKYYTEFGPGRYVKDFEVGK